MDDRRGSGGAPPAPPGPGSGRSHAPPTVAVGPRGSAATSGRPPSRSPSTSAGPGGARPRARSSPTATRGAGVRCLVHALTERRHLRWALDAAPPSLWGPMTSILAWKADTAPWRTPTSTCSTPSTSCGGATDAAKALVELSRRLALLPTADAVRRRANCLRAAVSTLHRPGEHAVRPGEARRHGRRLARVEIPRSRTPHAHLGNSQSALSKNASNVSKIAERVRRRTAASSRCRWRSFGGSTCWPARAPTSCGAEPAARATRPR